MPVPVSCGFTDFLYADIDTCMDFAAYTITDQYVLFQSTSPEMISFQTCTRLL